MTSGATALSTSEATAVFPPTLQSAKLSVRSITSKTLSPKVGLGVGDKVGDGVGDAVRSVGSGVGKKVGDSEGAADSCPLAGPITAMLTNNTFEKQLKGVPSMCIGAIPPQKAMANNARRRKLVKVFMVFCWLKAFVKGNQSDGCTVSLQFRHFFSISR